jgi:hypothetical protein
MRCVDSTRQDKMNDNGIQLKYDMDQANMNSIDENVRVTMTDG